MPIIPKVKKYLGEVVLIVGTGIFFYNLFNFRYTGGHGGLDEGLEGIGLPNLPGFRDGYKFEFVAYYYSNETLLLITMGAMLIVIGILIIRSKT